MSLQSGPMLAVSGLTTEFPLKGGSVIRAVDDISFTLAAGRTLGIVGESGSGKSVLIRSLMRILDAPGRIAAGSVVFKGRDLLRIGEREMRGIRGRQIGMIFQNPAGSLSPVATVASQFAEAMRAHERVGAAAARDRSIRALAAVGVEDSAAVLASRPYQLSGGLIQRIMIGLALVMGPDLILADEPTTNLDVTVQEQIIAALRKVQRDFGTAIIFISHDMGVISEISDDIMVMYGARAVEYGDLRSVVRTPLHPYTDGLIRSVPPADIRPGMRLQAIPGYPPDLSRLGGSCRFASRCARVRPPCEANDPALAEQAPGRLVACHFPLAVTADV
ncbi:MAG: ABC transporter ATP-binding protein [Rhizobiaceae bacterium]|nr:ABC transporter ATP-binding protein [Rhizobiaceae bacterium]